ncbi:hypothetical protein CLV63_112211 [Murinocardiopsis flavida]|uniref:Uncharacterized protein n=1 Tax=Murinocardiopsis flavida TaxID=645275 RepID=A0A2P8DGL9_9ACTN|nr:hypothetical protein [Murinocardiopsis flavida]PSK96326.1 hypothetical protein CLV63_112211 [Murinocardiopsis flavida]
MGHAVVPRPVARAKHEKPTENRVETRPTENNIDNKIERDTQTVTVTD